MSKFCMLPMATRTPTPLLADGHPVDFSQRRTLLGLSISTRGYTAHVTQRVPRARAALTKLYRFRSLDQNLKLHLIKALVILILTYPPIPTNAFSKTAVSRLQRVQNNALRFALSVCWDDFRTAESLHEEAEVPAINIKIHQMASDIWGRLEEEGWDQCLKLRKMHERAPDRNHAWFPRSLLCLERDPVPQPRYRGVFLVAQECLCRCPFFHSSGIAPRKQWEDGVAFPFSSGGAEPLGNEPEDQD
ncbi:hypothetical protein E2C01_080006 [Portunus trituberculatus]|uniref:Uncharacterized protein n=1 Tax=Portunus trituberculatus TaxID=210409 RepID=A0A5B7IID2_PORTR|nr:hypothetical protein [Portunus trituberculatus]